MEGEILLTYANNRYDLHEDIYEYAKNLLKSEIGIKEITKNTEHIYNTKYLNWHKKNIVLCGYSNFAKKIIDYFNVQENDNKPQNLFVIDTITSTDIYKGIPIYNVKDFQFKNDYIYIICTNPYLGYYADLLLKLNYELVITYHFLSFCDKKFDFELDRYSGKNFLNQINHFCDNKNFYLNILEKLADKKSKVILSRLIVYLFTLETRACVIEKSPAPAYFDQHIILASDCKIFVDCGGYNGDTLKEFLLVIKEYDEYWLFEPDEDLLFQAMSVSKDKKIKFNAIAVSDKQGVAYFEKNSSDTGCISPKGNILVKTNSLDNLIKSQIGAIKLDIEGGEYEALKGSKNHIITSKPKLIVSVYHKVDDIKTIYNLILSYRDDYKIYLRCCCDSLFTDLIMYYI